MLKSASDIIPRHLTITIEQFHLHKGNWLLWRNLGHFDQSGSWVAPVSFVEAQSLPKDMLDTFFELDNLVSKTIKQTAKKNGK